MATPPAPAAGSSCIALCNPRHILRHALRGGTTAGIARHLEAGRRSGAQLEPQGLDLERRDLAGSEPGLLAELQDELQTFRAQLGARPRPREPRLTDDDRERLRSLGYRD